MVVPDWTAGMVDQETWSGACQRRNRLEKWPTTIRRKYTELVSPRQLGITDQLVEVGNSSKGCKVTADNMVVGALSIW